MGRMTKEDAITLLVAEQAGIVKLDENRKRRALHALNDAVYEIDKAGIAAEVRVLGPVGVPEATARMDAEALQNTARQAERMASAVAAAEKRFLETRDRLGYRMSFFGGGMPPAEISVETPSVDVPAKVYLADELVGSNVRSGAPS
jgi:hypothetical protein